QICERVADFGALIEAKTPDDAIGDAGRDEAVFEFARLVLRAHQNGDVVEGLANPLRAFDFLADAARFLGAVPHAQHLDLLARVELGPELLAEATAIVGDHARGGAEDVRGGAVILLQPDDLGAGELLLELQDILDLRAAPRIDRLVVIAD